MCIQHVATFEECGHSSEYVETEGCQTKDCVNPPKQKAFHRNQKCLECTGNVRRNLGLYYKHCHLSTICDHEYGHAFTDAERDPSEEDIVLVTPVLYQLCPLCEEKGYDRRPGGTNPPPKTASLIPRDFQDIERVECPAITFLNADGISIDGRTAVPSNNRASSRRPSKLPTHISMAPCLPHSQNYLPSSCKPTSSASQENLGPFATELARITIPTPMTTDHARGSSRNTPPSSSNTPDPSKSHANLQPSSPTTGKPLPSQDQHKRVRFVLPPTINGDLDLERRMNRVTLRPILKRSSASSAVPRVALDGAIIPPERNLAGNSVYPRVDASMSRTPVLSKGRTHIHKKSGGS